MKYWKFILCTFLGLVTISIYIALTGPEAQINVPVITEKANTKEDIKIIKSNEKIDYKYLINTEEESKKLIQRGKEIKENYKGSPVYTEVLYKDTPKEVNVKVIPNKKMNDRDIIIADSGVKFDNPLKVEEDFTEEDIIENKRNDEEVNIKDFTSLGVFEVTAYDLSKDSTDKNIGDEDHGKTASGYSLLGMTREEAMSVAVDKTLIPLGSKIYLEFSGAYSIYNGIYTARDTGGAIKDKIIDLFMGDFKSNEEHPSLNKFGRNLANVYLVSAP
jgi:3D (Asp-Asp-Asp) domain-containing protein